MDLQRLCSLKQSAVQNINFTEENLNEEIKYNNCKIEDLDINFTLPGYSQIELIPDGRSTILSIYNIEQYLSLIFESLCGNGVKTFFEEFKKGFNLVFSIDSLKCFNSKEIELNFFSDFNENWDYETLYENIIPNHGFNKNR